MITQACAPGLTQRYLLTSLSLPFSTAFCRVRSTIPIGRKTHGNLAEGSVPQESRRTTRRHSGGENTDPAANVKEMAESPQYKKVRQLLHHIQHLIIMLVLPSFSDV